MYNVIIVEDDAIVRTYLSGLLEWEAHGMKIVGKFTNGREAKQFIEEQNVDIVITDVSMPVMNGIELIKYIKSTEKLIKVIVLSCHDDYEFIREALKCGVSDYILKQYLTKENLLELIEKLIGDLKVEKDSVIYSREASEAINSKKIVDTNNGENDLYRSEILKAVEYIENHCTEDIYLKDVANHVNISQNYFSMIFKKETGVVFSEFLLNARLEKSKVFLKKKGIKIYEAAFKAGFNNNQYFNRIFKQKFGVTPLAFKREWEQLEKCK